jgi:cell division protein FtsL
MEGCGMTARGGAIWMVLALISAVAAFTLKYEVRDLAEQLASLEHQISESRETSHVLRAEWSYLSRPERLAELAERHLDLAPMDVGQMGQLIEVPLREHPLEEELASELAEGTLITYQVAQP